MSQRNFQLGSQSVNSCSDVSVTVNNGHGPSAGYVPGSAVTVQPVLTQQPVPRQQPTTKVLLKAVNKKRMLVLKTFTLRNVNSSLVNTCSQMKALEISYVVTLLKEILI